MLKYIKSINQIENESAQQNPAKYSIAIKDDHGEQVVKIDGGDNDASINIDQQLTHLLNYQYNADDSDW